MVHNLPSYLASSFTNGKRHEGAHDVTTLTSAVRTARLAPPAVRRHAATLAGSSDWDFKAPAESQTRA